MLVTVVLIKGTVQLSLLFGTRGNVEVKCMGIKGKLYINSLVIDFRKDDPGLMYENIDTCRSICKFLPFLFQG